MKPLQFYITVALAAVCLILSIAVIALGQSNQRLQTEAQNQQNDINRGTMSQQIGTKILQDMASVAVKNDKMKEVLAKNGYTVTVNPAPSPTPNP